MQSQRFPLFPSLQPQLAVCPQLWPGERRGWPIRQGRAVAGPVRPDHTGGSRLAPRCPREDPPSPGTFGHRHRVTNPVMSTRLLRPAFGEEPRGARGPPPGGAKAGPQVESWGVRSRLSALVAGLMSLHDTTGHQVPRWEPLRFRLFAWSPPLVRALISLRPLGFPVPRRFRRTTPPAFVRAPNPSSGSRPAAPPLACPYSRVRLYDPLPLLR